MATKPLIALDARCTKQMSVGMQRYARELATRLPVVAPDLAFHAYRRGENFGYAEQIRLPLLLARAKPQVVHHLALYAPLIGVYPTVVTMHDLIHLQFPHYFKRHIPWYYQTAVRLLLQRAVRVITDDQRTVYELQKRLGVDPDKIRVIPLGVDHAFLQPEFDRPDVGHTRERPYLFYAGNHRPHKNLEMLITAWATLEDHVPYDLVLTGNDDFPVNLPRRRANGARLFCLGTLDELHLIRVLQAATALVYPSLSEGFGLPMLEALAVGTAVIASDTAVPEVLREACTVVNPRDVAAWRAAIGRLCPSTEGERSWRRAYGGALTWDRCAAQTADCYREVLEEQTSRVYSSKRP